jgi:TonB family protein
MNLPNSGMNGASRASQEGTADVTAPATKPRSKQRRSAYLVTAEDALWPQVGAVVSSDTVLTQVDSVEQLLGLIEPEYAGVVIWDARGDGAYADHLAQLQRHSARLAVMVLDDPGMSAHWSRLVQKKQIVASITLPLAAHDFNDLIRAAWEEVQVRTALLGGDGTTPPRAVAASSKSRLPVIIAGSLVAAVMAAVVLYKIKPSQPDLPHAPSPAPAAPRASTVPAAPAATASDAVVPANRGASLDDSPDALLEKAAQAMLDRRYIEPAGNSALDYYRRVLADDAANAEARQGLDRLEGLLVTKAQTALDQRSIESALQALETARTINRDDPRLQALDSRLAKMRSELGPTAIQAALNAGNYERATTLIDEAAQAKTLPAAQLAQLRDEAHAKRDGDDLERYVKTAQLRVQQGRLLDPASDSAAHWFALAEKRGATAATLSAPLHDFGQRLMTAARTAIDQGRLTDADRLITEAKTHDVPPAAIAELQNAMAAAAQRGQQTSPDQHFADLVKSSLAKGNLLEPRDDNALFYLTALRALNAQNGSLSSLTQQLQAQLLTRANALLDQNAPADAQRFLQNAQSLGPSAEAAAVADRLSKLAQSPAAAAPERNLVKPIVSKYPVEAAQSGLEGWVDLKFNILPNGRTSAVHVINSSQTVFDSAARDAVLSARYEPIAKGAPQVTVESQMRLTFKLAAR